MHITEVRGRNFILRGKKKGRKFAGKLIRANKKNDFIKVFQSKDLLKVEMFQDEYTTPLCASFTLLGWMKISFQTIIQTTLKRSLLKYIYILKSKHYWWTHINSAGGVICVIKIESYVKMSNQSFYWISL